MTEGSAFFWLFFRFRGRVSRKAFLLASLFTSFVVAFPFYRYSLVLPASTAAETWRGLFGLALLAGVWSSVALGAKRLHDIGKPGVVAVTLLLPVISVVAFIALCAIQGDPGPNQYGDRPDEPA